MSNFAQIIGFFVLIILFSFYTGDGGMPSGYEENSSRNGFEQVDGQLSSAGGVTESPRTLSEQDIEERIADISEDIGDLREEERMARLREPKSPYQGLMTLDIGNAREERWSREYVTLRSSRGAPPIDITGWSLESYVTRERTKIPSGDRVIETYGYPVFERIVLLPGEDAYLISGRSPVKSSFHENRCTGYFAEEKEVYPSLRRDCPGPLDEMEAFGRIAYTNDDCYDFVENLPWCEAVEKEELREMLDARDLSLSSACRSFIVNELTYDSCVDNHKNDPLFDNVGSWYIYLGRTRDLWRAEREIIRLLDRDGRVVDVVEY